MVTKPKKSRRSSTTAVPASPAAANLDDPIIGTSETKQSTSEVVQVLAVHLGKHVSQDELLAYRLVCKEWRKALPAGRTHIVLENPRASGMTSLLEVFPAVDSISFVISERLPSAELRAITAALATGSLSSRIKHLSFSSTSPQGSRSSGWPMEMPFWPLQLPELKALESLNFVGRAPGTSEVRQVVEKCPGLTSLVLGTQHGEQLTPISNETAERMDARSSSLAVLSTLTSLRRLALTAGTIIDVDETWNIVYDAMTESVSKLAALTGLTELRLAGQPITIAAARSVLQNLKDLRHLTLGFRGVHGKLYERGDHLLWRRLSSVDLRLESRVLEGDLQLLTLGLATSLRSLHLKSCYVSPYSVTALSGLVALRDLSLGAWTPLGGRAPGAQADGEAAAAEDPLEDAQQANPVRAAATTAVRSALVGLLSGRLGRQLEALRIDMAGPGMGMCRNFGSIARSAWLPSSPLRVLHLINANSYALAATDALSFLADLRGLEDLRVAVQGVPCRDGAGLRAAWLPPNLTSLELVGLSLPCAEEERRELQAQRQQQPQQPGQQGPDSSGTHQATDQPEHRGRPASGSHDEQTGRQRPLPQQQEQGQPGPQDLQQRNTEGIVRRRSSLRSAHGRPPIPTAPAAMASAATAAVRAPPAGTGGSGDGAQAGPSRGGGDDGAGGVAASGSGGGPCDTACLGHGRLHKLRRLSLRGCKFGCCGHLAAAIGPAVAPHLASLELDEVAGLQEAHLEGLAALTGLTSLAVVAMGHPDITSSSMGCVSRLTKLRRLKWHAGDSLDAPPHPAMLKSLRRLVVLDVSSSQYTRMARWHTASALTEELPMCELAAN